MDKVCPKDVFGGRAYRNFATSSPGLFPLSRWRVGAKKKLANSRSRVFKNIGDFDCFKMAAGSRLTNFCGHVTCFFAPPFWTPRRLRGRGWPLGMLWFKNVWAQPRSQGLSSSRPGNEVGLGLYLEGILSLKPSKHINKSYAAQKLTIIGRRVASSAGNSWVSGVWGKKAPTQSFSSPQPFRIS